jgi:NADH-quinone oxidoreductase subunit G
MQEGFALNDATEDKPLTLEICFGTSCFIRGAQTLYRDLMSYVRAEGLEDSTVFKANFCEKQCKKGPVLRVNGKSIERCTLQLAKQEITKAMELVR